MLEQAHFTRVSKDERDFTCDVCGTNVQGNGYTNHCLNCGASKHVDGDHPGDRASTCHGVMEPIELQIKNGTEYLVHRCEKCGHTRSNKVSPNDNRETIYLIASHQWRRSMFQR